MRLPGLLDGAAEGRAIESLFLNIRWNRMLGVEALDLDRFCEPADDNRIMRFRFLTARVNGINSTICRIPNSWDIHLCNRKSLFDHGAFLLVNGFEPLNINFTYFWIYTMVKVFTFPLESNLSIDKNRSTSAVGGFWEIDAPKGTCSEPHSSPKSGENTIQKDYLSKNLIEKWEIVKKLKCFQANMGIELLEISRST